MDDNQRFLQFLATRGIRRVSIPSDTARTFPAAQNYTHETVADQYQIEYGGRLYTVPMDSEDSFHSAMQLEVSDTDSEHEQEQPVAIHESAIDDASDVSGEDEDDEVIDFLSFTRNNEDADRFYHERRESFNTSTLFDDAADLSDPEETRYEYLQTAKSAIKSDENKIKQIETVYSRLVTHDEQTAHEIQEVPTMRIDYENGVGNGGVYNPTDPDLTTIQTHNVSSIIKRAPAEKVKDPLQLTYKGIMKLTSQDAARKYKNNLSCVIHDGSNDYLVNAANSDILIYGFNPFNYLPYPRHILKFDTRPSFTTTTDRLISTWPYFPHTINYMKVFKWLDEEALGICIDDGTLMIWFTRTLSASIRKFGATKVENVEDNYVDNRFFGLKINPDFKIKLESSCWGLDAISYEDDQANRHHLLVCSDNSQSITLFYYSKPDQKFSHCKSHQVLHNVPNVEFSHAEAAANTHEVKINCCSISGELIVFLFKFRICSGPINFSDDGPLARNTTYYVDPTMQQLENANPIIEENSFHRIEYFQPKVINRALLTEDCWTVNLINKKYFKHVDSIRAVFSCHDIDETSEVRRVINESLILDMVHDPKQSNALGLCSRFQYYDIPVLVLDDAPSDQTRLTTRDDDYRRVNKVFNKMKSLYGESEFMPEEDQDFLIVSTSKKVGLFAQESLFCNCSTATLFTLSLPFNDDSKFSNRISISATIPELSCYIAVSQQGLISIFRLCQHRGIFGMRQEYLFPNAISLSLGNNGYRTISGLSVRNLSVPQATTRFILYIIYTDGLVLTYEIAEPMREGLASATFV